MIAPARASAPASPIEWGLATRPSLGEAESGDLHVVAAFSGGVLVAVLDGLGHGPEAALASRVAAATLHDNLGEPVTVLMERCHAALHGTRGAVLSLAVIERQGREM